MSTINTNSPPAKAPYLRTTRSFPAQAQELSVQLNKMYNDIASAVNNRVIGLFYTGVKSITGENWFINSTSANPTIRQVYTFTAAGNIAHGLNFNDIVAFSQAYGSFTDSTNYYGAIYGSNIAVAGQVSFYITPANIVVLSGAGAPTIVSGTIVLEWLVNS